MISLPCFIRITLAALLTGSLLFGCATLPEPKFKKYPFPEEDVYRDEPIAGKPYEKIGPVRARVDFSVMTPDRSDEELCSNYFNKAMRDLLYKAKRDMNADAVMNVRSVVFYMDGKRELHRDPQCSEDEAEGQILVQGDAIRWTKPQPAAKSGRAKKKLK